MHVGRVVTGVAGHNGLVSAAYLAQSGLDVLVLERRHIVGGAAVTGLMDWVFERVPRDRWPER